MTGVETFMRLRAQLVKSGGTLYISGLKLPVEQVLERASALQKDSRLVLYRTDAEALAALQSKPSSVQ